MTRILLVSANEPELRSVAEQLAARYDIRVLVQDSASDAARYLRSLGAEVVQGDLSDRPSLRRALRDVYGVLGLTTEPEHGRNLIHAVAGAEVEHFVFGTSQYGLELYARSLGLPATFLEPARGEMPPDRIATIFEEPDHHIGERVVA